MELLTQVSLLLSEWWVWIILIASVMYAAGNYIDELLLHDFEQEIGTLLIISTLFGIVVATFFFIFAALTDTNVWLDTPILFQALLVGVLEALWVIPYLYATERSGAIIAGPLFQAVPVFALGFESFLGVIPPPLQLIGALFIVAGGIIISIEEEEEIDGSTTRRIDWTTIAMMSASAIIVALIYVIFRDAALETNFVSVGFWVGLGTFITGILIYAFWAPYRRDFNTFCTNANPKAVLIQLGNEVLDVGGAYLTNLAAAMGPSVMVVTAFNATQPIAVGMIGALLTYFGYSGISTERAGKGAWLLIGFGIVLIATGIVIVALGT